MADRVKRRLLAAALLVTLAGCGVSVSALKDPAPPNGTPFEQAVWAKANDYRVANGRNADTWDNGLASREDDWLAHLAATDCNSTVTYCHSGPGEILLWYGPASGGCSETDQRAASTAYYWSQSTGGHREYLLGVNGWQTNSQAGAASLCYWSAVYGGWTQIIAWAGA